MTQAGRLACRGAGPEQLPEHGAGQPAQGAAADRGDAAAQRAAVNHEALRGLKATLAVAWQRSAGSAIITIQCCSSGGSHCQGLTVVWQGVSNAMHVVADVVQSLTIRR